MLDINFIRQNPEQVRQSEKKRNRDPTVIDQVLKLDEEWKKKQKEVEELKHLRNVVSEEINAAKKHKNEQQAVKKIKQMKEVAENIKETESKSQELLHQRNETIKKIGNMLDKSVPEGKDESENKELKKS